MASPFNHSFVGATNDHLYNAASRALAQLAAVVNLDRNRWLQMISEMAEAFSVAEHCPECGEWVAPHAIALHAGTMAAYFSCPNRPCPSAWRSDVVASR